MENKEYRGVFQGRMLRKIFVFIVVLLILLSLIFIIVKYKERFTGKTKENSISGKVTAEINLENSNSEPRILRWWKNLFSMRKES